MISRLAVQNEGDSARAVVSKQLQQEDRSSLHSLSPNGDQHSSSSSLSNTDSDSLKSMQKRLMMGSSSFAPSVLASDNNNTIANPSTSPPPPPPLPALVNPNKSPILIKYNYYDYNGARQEQTNQDMHFTHHQPVGKVQRQLSPTFKQSLDQIVRNSQLMQQSNKISPSSSPEDNYSMHGSQNEIVQLTRRYKLSSYEQRCLRCNETVYQMDKVGPLKDFTFYHKNCFKCRECGTTLTLKTYFNNQQQSGDQEVYCHRHCPKTPPGRLDNQSVGIRAALNAPKVFDVLQSAGHLAGLDNHGLSQAYEFEHANNGNNCSPNVDSHALYIRHAVQQTRLQSIYSGTGNNNKPIQHRQRQTQPQEQQQHQEQQFKQQVDNKELTQLINRRLEFLEPKQKLLEMRHREEEDALFQAFELKWRQEESCISEQIRTEWQVELGKLLEKYRRQLSNISNQRPVASWQKLHQQQPSIALDETRRSKMHSAEQQVIPTVDGTESTVGGFSGEGMKQQMIELERMNLEKTMTIKLDRKKETLKRKLKEFERQATAELVEKQSREMLALISMKLDEYKEEQKRKIGSDLEQLEAMDFLANQLGSSLQLAVSGQQAQLRNQTSNKLAMDEPAPKPPQVSKMELYNNEEADEVFKDIDQLAINVAREDQQTFTDLVHHLTRHCITEVEKVRAIFRWITVKNLNTMQFDSSIKPDTPLGLLRGIKNGSESYHVLFKRLCSYAGLHCVVIKGYSKSAGYQPGVKFEGNKFRNSWNAVFVAGSWRFVQCNWGARHLVSVAVMQDKNQSSAKKSHPMFAENNGRPEKQLFPSARPISSPNHGRSRHQPVFNNYKTSYYNNDLTPRSGHQQLETNNRHPVSHHHQHQSHHHRHHQSPKSSPSSSTSSNLSSPTCSSPSYSSRQQQQTQSTGGGGGKNDSLRYEYDDHYFLTDPDEFIYEFHPLSPEWQLIKTRPITLSEFEQLPFVRSLFFKYGLYFPQHNIRSVLHTDSSGATTIKIGMPTHMVPSLIFHYNLKYYDSDAEHYEGVSLKRFVMQSIESGAGDGQSLLSNIVSFRVHLPENGSYILDIFANSTTPTQYITGEPIKFKSVCKFKIIAKNLKTVMIPLPDCASGEYGPMKATRLFGIIPITHENGLILVRNEKRLLEIQFRMTRPLVDFLASLHKNGYDERQLSKSIKIFIDSDIVFIKIKFFEDGQYGLDLYTRDQLTPILNVQDTRTDEDKLVSSNHGQSEPKRQLLTHCCKYLINVRTTHESQ